MKMPAAGTFGSRRIEQSTYDNVAVRLLTGDMHPDRDTNLKRLHRLGAGQKLARAVPAKTRRSLQV